MSYLERFFAFFGRPVLMLGESVNALGAFILFHVQLLPLFFAPPFRHRELFVQMERIGANSFWVIALTAIFTGMVLAIQFYHGFERFGAEDFMGYTIFIAITRELGPVFAALMLVSRAISAMAAELGTMRVTEQIDALDALAVDSRHYLLTPRILATSLMLPALVVVFDFVGNLSAYFVATQVLDVNAVRYQNAITQYLVTGDVTTSLIKAAVFGYLVSLVGSYVGYFASGGARGVGQATTRAVVYAAVTIFGANYLLSALFLAMEW